MAGRFDIVALDAGLLRLMTETIVWSTAGALSSYGVPTWSTGNGHSMAARILREHDEIRDKTGGVKEAQGTIWCAAVHGSTFIPDTSTRLSLPDGTSPPVLTVETIPDENGTPHHKVKFGY